MVPGGGLLLSRLRELACGEVMRDPNKGGPEPLMHQGHLVPDEPANEDFIGFPKRLENSEDVAAFWMPPPTAFDGAFCDNFCEPRYGPFRRREHDAVLPDEFDGFAGGHATATIAVSRE